MPAITNQMTPIRHVLDLSKEEKRQFLDSFDTIMSDCDGVVWDFIGPIPGVDKALPLLKKKGKKLAFISNNGMRTMEEYKQKFLKLGIPSHELDIVHPALTTVRYLKAINMTDAVYCVATEVFKDYLRNEQYTVLDGVCSFACVLNHRDLTMLPFPFNSLTIVSLTKERPIRFACSRISSRNRTAPGLVRSFWILT